MVVRAVQYFPSKMDAHPTGGYEASHIFWYFGHWKSTNSSWIPRAYTDPGNFSAIQVSIEGDFCNRSHGHGGQGSGIGKEPPHTCGSFHLHLLDAIGWTHSMTYLGWPSNLITALLPKLTLVHLTSSAWRHHQQKLSVLRVWPLTWLNWFELLIWPVWKEQLSVSNSHNCFLRYRWLKSPLEPVATGRLTNQPP